MTDQSRPLRVLQSFPHKIGAGRICTTAWHQAEGVAAAGADLLVMTGAVVRPLPSGIRVRTTLARGKYAVPYRALGGKRALQLHDRLVARALPKLAGEIDIVHAWPVGALHTLQAARRLGIPTVLERRNAHTRFAYEVVRDECARLDVQLPPGHEHAYNEDILEPRGAGVRAGRQAAVPLGVRGRDVRGPGLPRGAADPAHLRLRRFAVHSSDAPRATTREGSPSSSSASARCARACTSRLRRGWRRRRARPASSGSRASSFPITRRGSRRCSPTRAWRSWAIARTSPS